MKSGSSSNVNVKGEETSLTSVCGSFTVVWPKVERNAKKIKNIGTM